MAPWNVKFFCQKEVVYKICDDDNANPEESAESAESVVIRPVEVSIVKYYNHLTNMTSIIFANGRITFGKIIGGDVDDNDENKCKLYIYPVKNIIVRAFGEYNHGRKIEFVFENDAVVINCSSNDKVYSTNDIGFKTYVEDWKFGYGGWNNRIIFATLRIFKKYLNKECSYKTFFDEKREAYKMCRRLVL